MIINIIIFNIITTILTLIALFQTTHFLAYLANAYRLMSFWRLAKSVHPNHSL